MKFVRALAVLCLMTACGSEKTSRNNRNEDVSKKIHWQESDKRYLREYTGPTKELQNRANQINVFSSKLLKEIQEAEGDNNTLISSVSIQTAFSLLYPAAVSVDEREISDVLGFGDKPAFYDSMRGLTQKLLQSDEHEKVELKITNNVWSREDLHLKENYLDTIKMHFNARTAKMDFMGKAEPSRKLINEYIAQNTNQMIQNLLPPGFITPSTTTVLTNAIYLKAPWVVPFMKEGTREGDFRTPTKTVKAQYMVQLDQYFSNASVSSDMYSALSMPFEGNLAIMFLQSRTDDWRYVKNLLGNEDFWRHRWPKLFSTLTPHETVVKIPKFKFKTNVSLVEHFKKLGLGQVFEGSNKNFTELYEERLSQAITGIQHATAIDLNESGVEAAAATAIGIGETSIPGPEFEFTVDEPTFYVIYDMTYGTALFMGLLVDPTSES